MNRDRALDQVKAATFIGKNAAFLGCLLCGLTFSWSKEIPTAGVTTNNRFIWNPDWFDSLTFEERKFILLHELWHIALLHGIRCGNRDPQKWVAACDYRINANLINDGYEQMPAGGLINEDWMSPEWSEEDIYKELPANFNNKQAWGGDSLDQMSQTEQIALVQTALNAAKMAGDVPGEVEKTFHEFVKPKLNWKVLLHRYLLDLIEPDYSWIKPNRRFRDIYLPSLLPQEGRLISIAVFLDTSGSISDEEIKRFTSEVKFIQENLNPEKLMVIQFDTQIQDEKIYTSEDRFKDIEIKGYGGTSFKPVRNYILKHKPTLSLIFTDLEAVPMEEVGKNKVIWVTTANFDAEVGETIHVEE